jgi:hypothetical protein
MEILEDLELENMKALGLCIKKCVDEVLRSHLVERPLNTTKNYVPKQKVSAGMRLVQPFTLAWLSPTPTMAISEMPTDESQGLMEA